MFGTIGELMKFLKITLILLSLSFFYLPVFIRKTFGSVNFDQLMFFVFTDGGTVGTDFSVYVNFVKWAILRPFVLFIVLYLIFALLIRSKLFNEFIKKANHFIILFAFLSLSVLYNAYSFGGASFFKRYVGRDQLPLYFTDFDFEQIKPVAKNNLILLYVESLENTFSDVSLMGYDLNAPLTSKFGPSRFDLRQAPGTGWTTAGMVSSQCGLPLAPFMGNSLEHRAAPILGKLTCLGDILNKFGYSQTFFVGPDLKFSGMDKFYLNHGFQYAYGKDEIFSGLASEKLATGWGGGVNDDTLFDLAVDKIKFELNNKQNFNVTIMTTDNHASDGFLSPRCTKNGFINQISEVIFCTNKSIVNFVENLESLNVFENTILVVMGDHNFMGEIGGAKPFGDRPIYFNYIGADSAKYHPETSTLTHFDVFPSILQLLFGYEVKELHLGSNIFSKEGPGISEKNNYIFGDSFLNYSQFYRTFW